jgi:hypothetical protein
VLVSEIDRKPSVSLRRRLEEDIARFGGRIYPERVEESNRQLDKELLRKSRGNSKVDKIADW